jgi:hypothetical protein
MKRDYLLRLTPILCWGLLKGCSTTINGSLSSGSLFVNTIGLSETDTSVAFTPDSGVAYTSVTADEGASFSFETICRGATIFGKPGYASFSASNLLRDFGTTQLSLPSEVKTY